MASGRGEHDESDRAFLAVALLAIGLIGAGIALVHRQGMAHSSAVGDACPVTASGALVGFDAETGDVRWTTIIPSGAELSVEEGDGPHVEARTLRGGPREPYGTVDVTERTVDPDNGRITTCAATRSVMDDGELYAFFEDRGPTEPPIQLDGLTIMNWGDGLRATDADGTGIWGTAHTRATARLGDTILVEARRGEEHLVEVLDLRTGDEVWSASERLASTPSDGDPVITRSKADHRTITARDGATGAVRWRTRLPAGFGSQDATVAGDLVLIPGGEGAQVAAVDLASGELRWTADGGSPGQNRLHTGPGLIHDLVRSPDGRTVIVAVDAQREAVYD